MKFISGDGLRPLRSRIRQINPLGVETVQVTVTCKHGSLKGDQQEYLTQKSEKLLTYFDRVTAIGVTVVFDKNRCSVEIKVDAEHKHDFVAIEEGDSVVPTFDLCLHKMEHQIRARKRSTHTDRHQLPANQFGR